MKRIVLISVLVLIVGGWIGVVYMKKDPPAPSNGSSVPIYRVEVVRTFPSDPALFTQGLAWDQGFLYIGSGKYGKSRVRKLDLENNIIIQDRALDSDYFGEGITVFKDRVVQLTWLKGTGFVYDKKDLSPKDQFQYTREGWGLTHDGEHLIMSDGSSYLYLLDPKTYKEKGRLKVTAENRPMVDLNELEFVENEIYANVLNTNGIARIDASTGRVVGWIAVGNLLTEEEIRKGAGVLNGIAYDPVGCRLFLTGKLWPRIFEVRVVSNAR